MNKQLETAVLRSTETSKKSYLQVGKCNITFGYRSGYLWIFNVETPDKFRGTGAASQALNALLEVSDKHGIKLKLEAVPLDDNGDMERLVRFYQLFGFKTQKQMKTATVMVRKPQRVSSKTASTTESSMMKTTPTVNLKKLAEATGGVLVLAASAAKSDAISRIVNRVNTRTGGEYTYSSQAGGIALEDAHGRRLTPRAPLKQFDAYCEVFITGFEHGKR